MKCKIDNDKWDYLGKVYNVIQKTEYEDTTAVTLTIEDEDGYIHTATVANHQIEWLKDE